MHSSDQNRYRKDSDFDQGKRSVRLDSARWISPERSGSELFYRFWTSPLSMNDRFKDRENLASSTNSWSDSCAVIKLTTSSESGPCWLIRLAHCAKSEALSPLISVVGLLIILLSVVMMSPSSCTKSVGAGTNSESVHHRYRRDWTFFVTHFRRRRRKFVRSDIAQIRVTHEDFVR